MKQLCSLVAEILGVEGSTIGPRTGPGTLPKWDSLGHIHLISAVEETYNVQLTADEIINVLSVSDLAALLEEKGVHVG